MCRLATTLEAPPAALCDKVPAPAGAADGFALDEGGARWRLVARGRDDGACAFAIALPSGRRICGLGTLAPAACSLTAGGDARDAATDRVHHEAVVASWNALVARRGGRYLLETFADHLMNACAEAPR